MASIRGHFSPIRKRHTFALTDGRSFKFCCEKVWKQVYLCEGQGESYRLYAHRGLKYSIFRDERQIAAITQNRLVIGRGNEYRIRMDSDADVVLLLCMMLTYNTGEEQDDDSASVTFDMGRIGPQGRAWDPNWKPC